MTQSIRAFDKGKRAVDQKWRDALDFIATGSTADAERLHVEIAALEFEPMAPHELARLNGYVDRAVAGLGTAIEGAKTCTAQN